MIVRHDGDERRRTGAGRALPPRACLLQGAAAVHVRRRDRPAADHDRQAAEEPAARILPRRASRREDLMDVACVAHTNDVLGEVPRWHALENALYWIDALKPAVHRFDPATRRGRKLDAAGEARLVRAERGRRADHRGAQRLRAVRPAWRRVRAHRRSGEQGGRRTSSTTAAATAAAASGPAR